MTMIPVHNEILIPTRGTLSIMKRDSPIIPIQDDETYVTGSFFSPKPGMGMISSADPKSCKREWKGNDLRFMQNADN
jgi:hypothetical protein